MPPSSRVAPDVARSHTRPRAHRDAHILFFVRVHRRLDAETPRIARDVPKRHRERCKNSMQLFVLATTSTGRERPAPSEGEN